MAKTRIKELARLIYISQLEEDPPTAYRVWKELVKKGESVSRPSVHSWIKRNREKWEEERQRNIERHNIKLNAEIVKENLAKSVKQVQSLSDIKENLLKEFEHIDGKSKEGVTRALIELEKALKDKTTSFTPPTSIIIKSKEYEEKIAQLVKKNECRTGSAKDSYVNNDSSSRVNETSKDEKSPKTPLLGLSTGKEPKSDEKQLPNEQPILLGYEGGDGGNKPTNNNE